jgi:ketosteroid isomerase-like protein
MMKKLFPCFTLLALACAPSMAVEPVANHGRVVATVTRTIQIFNTLENEWLDAIAKRDMDALKKIVADDFELRSAAAPGVPTPREESISSALKIAPFESSIEQMATHEYGDTVVVSFLWKLNAAKQALAPRVFVIDTWKRNGGGWQVVTRYVAPVGAANAIVPGAVTGEPQIKKKI